MKKAILLTLIFVVLCCATLFLTACGECDHSNADWEIKKAPTCLDEGLRVSRCKDCDKELKIEAMEPLGHAEVAMVDEPADCTHGATSGGKRCDRCGVVVVAPQVVSAPLGHVHKNNICECSRCGSVMDHDYADWDILREASCSQIGQKQRTCKVCGYIESVQITALPHTEEEIIAAEATCTLGGMSAGVKCKVCDEVLSIPSPVDALGHDFVGGRCSRCDKVDNHTEGLEYELKSYMNEYAVTGFKSGTDLTNLVIPSSYKGRPVVEIADNAFRSTESNPLHIVTLEIPFTVQTIGNYAFYSNEYLESVTFEENSRCYSIYSSFSGCTSLTELRLPANVSTLTNAFSNCTSLRSVNIPKNLRQIYGTTFARCNALEEIIIDEGNAWYKMQNGALYSQDGTRLIRYLLTRNDTTFVIPKTVTKVDEYCFNKSPHLTSITFENGSACSELGNHCFEDIDGLIEITIPKSVTQIGIFILSGCDNLSAVCFEADSALKYCGDRAFAECPVLVECVLPQSLEYIDDVFADSHDVTSPQVLPNVQRLRNTFKDCAKITSVDLSGNDVLLVLEGPVFSGSGITSVYLSSALREVSEGAFKDCVALRTVTIAAGSVCTKIGKSAFQGCVELTEISIPKTVASVGQMAFDGCSKLATVTFSGGSSPSTISKWAFRDCVSLTNVKLSDSLDKIEDRVFQGCIKLRKIVIPQSVQTVGQYVFDKCYEVVPLGDNGITYNKLKIYCEVEQGRCPSGWNNYYFDAYMDDNNRLAHYDVIWGYRE